MKCILFLACVALAAGLPVFAQQGAAPAPKAAPPAPADGAGSANPETGADAKEGPPPTPAPPQEGPGDVIRLKTGKELRGMQILRETPTAYIVEVLPGLPPLEIPRRQVMAVQYDEIDVARERRNAAGVPPGAASEVLPGQKLDPKLLDGLGTDISQPTLDVANQDLAGVLKQLGERAHVTISVEKPVLDLPEQERLWTIKVGPEAKLGSVLREDFLKQFPKLAVVYKGDTIVVTSKEAALAMKIKDDSLVIEGGVTPAPPPAAAPPATPPVPPAPSGEATPAPPAGAK